MHAFHHPASSDRASAEDVVEPTAAVAAMASAVERLRRMAATVFKGDAALFAGSTDPNAATPAPVPHYLRRNRFAASPPADSGS